MSCLDCHHAVEGQAAMDHRGLSIAKTLTSKNCKECHFAAPLAYVGVGLLAILVRMEPEGSTAFGPWVLLLALGGFVGNFALSVLDHAQNGFFRVTEWIPVVAAAFAASFLLVAVVRPHPTFLRLCRWVCGAEVLVGFTGFALHLLSEPASATASLLDRLVFGAPLFAPLLFANMALLAAIGLWAMAASSHGVARTALKTP